MLKPLQPHWLRLSKSIMVGLVATIADMLLLAVLVELFKVPPATANLPALVLGSCIQFVGNRRVVFDFKGIDHLNTQLLFFILSEVTAFFLNAGLYWVVVHWTPIHYMIARVLVTASIFLIFSFPSWTLIFRKKSPKEKGPPCIPTMLKLK